jgi:hypothetical protein
LVKMMLGMKAGHGLPGGLLSCKLRADIVGVGLRAGELAHGDGGR